MKAGRTIERLILSIRDQRVILAGDLAAVYGVETRRLNEQVRRNAGRFPGDFVFQLTEQELERLRSQNVILADGRAALRSQNAILKRGQHIKFPPYAFTEHGAIMAAMVLNSPEALAMRRRSRVTTHAVLWAPIGHLRLGRPPVLAMRIHWKGTISH